VLGPEIFNLDKVMWRRTTFEILLKHRILLFFIVKAMIEHLATAGTLNAPRKHRFSEQFNDDILNMVASLTDDVTKHYRKVTRTNGFGICLQRCHIKKG
jgi:hypothetical protein